MSAWSQRPRQQRYSIIGAIIGMLIAAPVAFVFAYEAGTIVRYLIMSAGFLAGFFGGAWVASRNPS